MRSAKAFLIRAELNSKLSRPVVLAAAHALTTRLDRHRLRFRHWWRENIWLRFRGGWPGWRINIGVRSRPGLRIGHRSWRRTWWNGRSIAKKSHKLAVNPFLRCAHHRHRFGSVFLARIFWMQ